MQFPHFFIFSFVSLRSVTMAGIYVHIPFCKSRCIYCGFYSTTLLPRQDEYVDCLLRELQMRKGYLKGEKVSTIYLGGGTPSLLTPANLSHLCSRLVEYADNGIDEFTIECNPDDVTPDFCELLSKSGINRVSMGAQTFSDSRLSFLHRRHKASHISNAVHHLRNAGFKNISIDLMFGFPGETLNDWKYDIDKAMTLEVEHISAYSLMYEEGTALFKLLESGKIQETDEDTSLKMYDLLIKSLTQAGYEHYEISNFAKPGYHSRHNSSYWHRIPYLGIGAGAHSYDISSRQWNISDLNGYIQKLANGELAIDEIEILDATENYNDIITTALRTKQGIDLTTLSAADCSYLMEAAKKGMSTGNIIIEESHLRLTRKGLYISDSVMVDLIR